MGEVGFEPTQAVLPTLQAGPALQTPALPRLEAVILEVARDRGR